MLGLWTTPYDKTGFSAAEAVYGAPLPLCLPGEFLHSEDLPPREFLDRIQSALWGFTHPPPHHVAPCPWSQTPVLSFVPAQGPVLRTEPAPGPVLRNEPAPVRLTRQVLSTTSSIPSALHHSRRWSWGEALWGPWMLSANLYCWISCLSILQLPHISINISFVYIVPLYS